MVEGPGAIAVYILTPNSHHNPGSLATEGLVEAGALVVDLGRFPPAVYRIGIQHDCIDVTEDLVEATDYWTVAREWLAEFTGGTGIQDVLAIRGFGFWWTLNGQKFVAGLKDLGNSFAWIDLLAAIRTGSKPRSIIVYGEHDIISYLVGEVFGLEIVQIRDTGPAQTGMASKSPRKYGLLVARLFLGILYFFHSLVRNPDVCVISNTNFLRRTLVQGKQRLYDVYVGSVSDRLRSRGWRVAVMEKYGPNASWAGFMARGFFFPSDLVFALSTPILRRLGLYRQTWSKWNKRWEALEPTLPRFLKYKGYDIAPLVLPMIKVECTEHGPELEVMIRIWRSLFKLWRPRLLYVNDSYSRSALPAIVAARSLNIETAEQQHGLIGRNHIAYLVPRHLGFESKFPLCGTMVAWGEHTKSFLINAGVYDPEQIAVCGFPRIDQLLGVLPPRRETRDKLGIPPDAPIVLYTSNGFAQDLMPSILDGLALVPEHSDTNWVVKLHPQEKTRHLWEAEIDRRGLGQVHICEGTFDFYALLEACDVHVTFASTTLIEAAILGKPNLGIDVGRTADPAGYAESNAFVPVAPERLGLEAERLLKDPGQMKAVVAEQKQFAEAWCLHDGNAVTRITSLLEEIML